MKMQSLLLHGLKHVATVASGLGEQKKLFILIYHRVFDEPDFMQPGEVDKKNFTWQMGLIEKYFNVLSLPDAIERMEKGMLPPRAVCITFDDGYADNYLNALPILKKKQLTATFFIASGYLNGGIMWNDSIIETLRNYTGKQLDLSDINLGHYSTRTNKEKSQAASKIIQKIKHLTPQKRQSITDYLCDTYINNLPDDLMLTNEQLLMLHQSNMEIGGHTVTHPIMSKTPFVQLQQEITNNKQTLESLLNTPIHFFAYPNGKPGQDYFPEQVQLIKDNGFKAAVSTQWGVANHKSDIFQLPRFTPWDLSPVKFMIRMIYMYLRTN